MFRLFDYSTKVSLICQLEVSLTVYNVLFGYSNRAVIFFVSDTLKLS